MTVDPDLTQSMLDAAHRRRVEACLSAIRDIIRLAHEQHMSGEIIAHLEALADLIGEGS